MSERPSEVDDPGFGGTVGGHTWGGLKARDAAKVDNAPSSGLMLHNDIRALAEHEDCREVDRDYCLEKPGRSRRSLRGRRPAGIVDEDVDMPEALLGNCDHFVNLVDIANVALKAEHLVFGMSRAAWVVMPATGDHRSSFFDKSRCDFLTDAAASTGDDRDLPRQFRSHQTRLLLSERHGASEDGGFER